MPVERSSHKTAFTFWSCTSLTSPERVILQRFVVAVDGGLFEHYPNYAERMTETFALLLGPKAKSLELIHSPDGSGIGSAVVAAATSS